MDATPRHFEDFAVGQVYELGTRGITSDEIIAFAREFDPQPFHVDEEAARDTAFGGLIASGWHTASIYMRCYADALLAGSASMGSPGVDELRWLVPVRPGDTLSSRCTVTEVRPSAKRADRGTVFLLSEVRNQRDEVVLSMTARGLFGRRPAP
jgi:acyl dehydratase